MTYGGRELARSFRTVRGNTLKIAEDIPESRYAFRPAPDTRSVAELLTHIALGHGFQSYVHGNCLDDLATVNFQELMLKAGAEEKRPRSKADIIELLKSEGDRFAAYLEGLSDAFLAEHVKMPAGATPASKSRFEMLLSPKEHEMHHRGQLMLIERLVGVVPHLTRERQQRMAAPPTRH